MTLQECETSIKYLKFLKGKSFNTPNIIIVISDIKPVQLDEYFEPFAFYKVKGKEQRIRLDHLLSTYPLLMP